MCMYVYVFICIYRYTEILISSEIFRKTSISNASNTFPACPKKDRNCFLPGWEQSQSRT